MSLLQRLRGLMRPTAKAPGGTATQTDAERAAARRYWDAQVAAQRNDRGVPSNRR